MSNWPLLSLLIWLPILGGALVLALGERRAETVKQFLEAQGVNAARISTVSFGKDNPLCTSNDAECWAKNRRVDFVYSGGYNG